MIEAILYALLRAAVDEMHPSPLVVRQRPRRLDYATGNAYVAWLHARGGAS